MLEAKLEEAAVLKRLLDAIKELVNDANFECNEEGINLQAMDNSHVALVSVLLKNTGFAKFRCDRPMPLGVNLASLTKVLKCAKDDDIVVIKATDEGDVLNLVYEARNSDRIAEYDMKLMDIDSDTLGIPDTDYDARVTMASAEFARIVRDLSQLGESVRIEVTKEGVRFASEGESANGNVLLKMEGGGGSHKRVTQMRDDDGGEEDDKKKVKKEDDVVMIDDDEAAEKAEREADGEEDEAPVTPKKSLKKKKKAGEDEEEAAPEEDEEDEEDEDEESNKKKRKKGPSGEKKPFKKTKKEKEITDDEPKGVNIEMNSAVNLTFSLKYLVTFAKSSSLSKTVELLMSNDVPLLVSYKFGQGHIRYYLAPKIGDD